MPSSPNDDDDDDAQHPSRPPGSTGRQHASSPTRELLWAFNLEDMVTIDSHRPPHAGDSCHGGAPRHDAHRHRSPQQQQQHYPPHQPWQQPQRRSPSPSNVSAISRPGRSRSPIGLTPNPLQQLSSRPSSRSNGRSSSVDNGRHTSRGQQHQGQSGSHPVSQARNGHASAHNNQLQLSERDKKIVDDLPRMEDGEKIREAAGESIER